MHPLTRTPLTLSDHVDPQTLQCTFKPVDEELKTLTFEQPCNGNRQPWSEIVLGFAVVSSAWFRPAKGKQWGSEIAAAPDRCPPCGAEIWAEVSQELDGCVEVCKANIGWNDWTASGFSLDRQQTSRETTYPPPFSVAHFPRRLCI